jgi:hypothetical protein
MSTMEHVEQEQRRGRMLEQVERSLADVEHGTRLDAASQLAKHYAALIDEAAPSRSYATAIRVLQQFVDTYAGHLPPNPARQVEEAWDKVSTALAEHSVASDLGPKLLAAMAKLGLTLAEPKAAAPKPAEPEQPSAPEDDAPSASVLQLLRGDAGRRNASA